MQPCDEHNRNPEFDESKPFRSPQPAPAEVPSYRYADLSKASNEVLIEHDGQIYRLRMTRNGKLILNK